MGDCPFCEFTISNAEKDLIAFQSDKVLVIPAPRQRPLNLGHMLVLPRSHITGLMDVDPLLMQELHRTADRVSVAVRKAFDASGVTVFQNDGTPDQVLFHVHIHVVPRNVGDDFKMPDPVKRDLTREERQSQALAVKNALI
jgi:histidine triad (HIT) family protein